LRPTANRVRETLFNWLGQTLHGKCCLDLFAGSGALGYEAASRGASEVIMVENEESVMQALETSRAKLGANQCRLVRQGASEFLAANKTRFNIVFLDPPFASGLMATILDQLVAHLDVDALVYAEWREPLADVLPALTQNQWRLQKTGKAGAVHFALLTLGKGET
jgi:16S rRNA (guanine966-N2)-methyltransferase